MSFVTDKWTFSQVLIDRDPTSNYENINFKLLAQKDSDYVDGMHVSSVTSVVVPLPQFIYSFTGRSTSLEGFTVVAGNILMDTAVAIYDGRIAEAKEGRLKAKRLNYVGHLFNAPGYNYTSQRNNGQH